MLIMENKKLKVRENKFGRIYREDKGDYLISFYGFEFILTVDMISVDNSLWYFNRLKQENGQEYF